MGQIIGAIAAETRTEAMRAAKAVVMTYKELVPIFTIQVYFKLFHACSSCIILRLFKLANQVIVKIKYYFNKSKINLEYNIRNILLLHSYYTTAKCPMEYDNLISM